MKKILCFVSVCVMLMLCTITSSAASESKFKLKLVSENDTQAVVSLDFAGGASFSAIDFNVEVNTDKVKVTNIVDGKGMTNFKLQAQAAVSQPNVKGDSAMVTAAMIPGYRNVDGEDLFVITLKKLTKDSLSNDDVKIVFTNCQDASFNNIEPVVTYELTTVSSEEASTTVTTTTAADSTPEDQTADNNAAQSQLAETSTNSAAAKDTETADDEKGDSTTMIIVVCVAVAVAAGGGACVYFIKKKKNSDNASKEG